MCTLRQWCYALLAVLALSLGLEGATYAKTFAYLFDRDGNVLTLDTDTDAITTRTRLKGISLSANDSWRIEASPADGLLFVISGRATFRIIAFDLKTLAFKKDLGIESSDDPEVLFPEHLTYFFVGWSDPKANAGLGGHVMSRIDKTALARSGDLPNFPILGTRSTFSVDGTRLYSHKDQTGILTLDSRDLSLLSTIDVQPLFAAGVWGKSIADMQGDTVLLSENTKSRQEDPNRLSFFTVRLPKGAPSPRIQTGLYGEAELVPAADKIILHEMSIIEFTGGGIDQIKSAGRLHVYEIASGTKLGQLIVSMRDGGTLFGIRPQGDKIYFLSGPAKGPEQVLMSFSLQSFSLVKELAVPPLRGLVFFEQP